MKCVKRDSGRKCLTPRTCAHMKVSSIDVNIVEKSFTQEIALKYHVSEHTGNYRFKCDHCGKGFNRFPQYEKHVLMHKGGGSA